MTATPWIGAAMPRDLSSADFQRAAARLGCDPAALRAVWEVEASGRCFDASGGVLRRFEPHHVPRALWSAMGFAPRAGQAPWRASLALSQSARARMFSTAAQLDMDAALMASSWGGPQIMGFNHGAAGSASARDMVEAMARGAPAHLDAFVALVTAWGLDAALRAHDWLSFARRYNGSGQPEVYAARIEAAFRRHSGGARSPVVLRVGDRGPAVAVLQEALGIPSDRAFGPLTLETVEAFQRAAGLPVDGVVGRRTWEALGVEAPVAADAPAQRSTAERRTALAATAAGYVAPVAAAVPAVVALQPTLPPVLWQVGLWVAFGLALVWIAPVVLRRVRGAWRT
ncbi:DUF3380 domain-containing protein [Rhodobacter sp. NTK016B]|uniref:N-acetylmuramidase domain-containing protein n=1 Tax=Rhodobacter sp. NTK016B TaxID=2759676 RepID=UPI001A8FF0D3|nr:N-acetylmuramidase domain-containing protein [Rhodobacter sp. NTK016B]MBN8291012.1 DUF3380 domain-containing protein [Rhodobacter sp. NTK016B]